MRRLPSSVRAQLNRCRLNAEWLEDRAVPAQMMTYVNDNWHLFLDADLSGGLSVGDIVINPNAQGPLTGYIYGVQAFGTVTSGHGITSPTALSGFATINDAIANTQSGGTVTVFEGTYTESVNVNKSVTLRGAQAGILTDTRTSGSSSETILVATGGAGFHLTASNVTIDGFTITAGTGAVHGIAEWTSLTGTTIRNNFISGFTSSLGVAIAAGSSNFQIVRNDVANNYGGIYLSVQAHSGTVSQNIVHNHTGSTGSDEGSGVLLEGNNTNVAITENIIRDNRHGVYVWTGFGDNFTNTTIFNNAITHNTAGITNTGPTVLDAWGNWWGTNDAAAVAALAGANVDFSPWLSSGTDTSTTAGFQGDFSALHVGLGGAQIGTVGRIQEGINRVTTGGTVSVTAGTYVENVTIDKNLTLVSTDGRAATTIEGISGVGALGTVRITNNTSGVTLGDVGRGFTIRGIDNGLPAVENAAVYFQGPHSNARVVGNEIIANGDSAMLTEFGVPISGFVIDSNIFSGQTFVGSTPATGNQFTVANVARQLVVMGNGGGNLATATTTNITFTNNQIIGTTGANGVGNTLVTLDVANSTIRGNTFAGTMDGFGAALRVRRPGTDIDNNTFISTNMADGTLLLFVQNNTTPIQDIIAANTFDRGAYVNNGSELSVSLTGGATRATSGSTLNILPGTYNESLNLTTGPLDKALTLAPVAGGPVTILGSLTLNADDALTLSVAQPLNVGGTLTLGNAALNLISPTTVPAGSSVVLINNLSSDPVGGTFAGLPQGASVTASNGQTFVISYAGGTGNDVTVTVPAPPVVVPPVPPVPPVVVPPVVPPPVVVPTRLFAVGAGPGANAHVKVYNADSSLRFSFFAFEGFNGGVTVATGDVTGDGIEDIVVGAATGVSNGHVKVFSGATGTLLASFLAFSGYSGGVSVAVGDINNDGRGDIIVGALNNASHVKVFDFASGSELMSFFAYDGFNGGVTVAAGNVDGVAGDEVITGVAASGPAHIKAFNFSGDTVVSFIANNSNTGVTVAAGPLLNNDSLAEILVGPAIGGGPVLIFSNGSTTPTATLDPSFAGNTSGLRVAVADVNNDNAAEILVAAGPGQNAVVKAFHPVTLDLVNSLVAFDDFLGGVFLG
ncbi:MAG: right-handed parallel beta-helix repeat-containing protein [Gemmataceae bacterium]|nr:right-handed parallel beta-helix repeat-containing protein [Gemmata sp.]MDW8198510.1 right-handed parallel beta-helix repeat-containing protein [Gemmataceae bacterium]